VAAIPTDSGIELTITLASFAYPSDNVDTKGGLASESLEEVATRRADDDG
jgi:hypothetical protein